MRLTRIPRRAVVLAGTVTIALEVSLAFVLGVANAAPKATFTTVNESFDGSGHCQQGNPDVNCNIYDGAQYVWLNGGPVGAALGDGQYFFAVVGPGGQNNPNDGAPRLLSTDAYTNRTFTVQNGTLSYSGTHAFDSNMIRLIPFAKTANNGGVYILAICSLANGVPADARDCKYDMFKTPAGAGDTSTTAVTIPGITTSTTEAGGGTTTSTTTEGGGGTTTTTVEQGTTTTFDL